MTTITQLTRLAKKVNQFFLLTHDLHFANDFNNACNEQILNLKIQNLNGGSALFLHDVRIEMLTGFNKDLMTLRRFLDGKIPEDAIYLREVIRCIRPTIEGIFRIKYFKRISETQWLSKNAYQNFLVIVWITTSCQPLIKKMQLRIRCGTTVSTVGAFSFFLFCKNRWRNPNPLPAQPWAKNIYKQRERFGKWVPSQAAPSIYKFSLMICSYNSTYFFPNVPLSW